MAKTLTREEFLKKISDNAVILSLAVLEDAKTICPPQSYSLPRDEAKMRTDITNGALSLVAQAIKRAIDLAYDDFSD